MDIARAIREVAAERGLRQADISRISGLSDAHVTQIWHGNFSVNILQSASGEPSLKIFFLYAPAHAQAEKHEFLYFLLFRKDMTIRTYSIQPGG